MEVDTNADTEAIEDRRIERAITIIAEAASLIERAVGQQPTHSSIREES